jgi:transposase
MKIPLALKERIVYRLLNEPQTTVSQLSKEYQIPNGTLWGWRDRAQRRIEIMHSKPTMQTIENSYLKSKYSQTDKFKLLLRARGLDENALGEFLRSEGLQEEELLLWEQEITGDLLRTPENNTREYKQRINELEREVARKNNALAEAAALILLQKKVQAYFAEEKDDTTRKI